MSFFDIDIRQNNSVNVNVKEFSNVMTLTMSFVLMSKKMSFLDIDSRPKTWFENKNYV